MDIDFLKSNYAEQIQALNAFIKECFPLFPLPQDASKIVRFGGGTALAMYYFQHRKSFDIDLFLTDPQYLAFVSPKHWLDDSSLFDTEKYIDRANHIRLLSRNKIKVDILVAQDFICPPLIDDSMRLFAAPIYVESLEDIIAKKIVHRKEQNLPRDIMDLGVALSRNNNFINSLLELGAISQEDICKLHTALSMINIQDYMDEVTVVNPEPKYLEICQNAPKIITEATAAILAKAFSVDNKELVGDVPTCRIKR